MSRLVQIISNKASLNIIKKRKSISDLLFFYKFNYTSLFFLNDELGSEIEICCNFSLSLIMRSSLHNKLTPASNN